MDATVYVDALNLYYGAVRGTAYKWLDIRRMCELLLAGHRIIKIKYFTAIVSGRAYDPDAPKRQQIYLRALETLPGLEIYRGHFLANEVRLPLAGCAPMCQNRATVIRTEEKGSDVNLATHLLTDGFRGAYELAVIVSNDSDLLEPVKVVRSELGKDLGLLNPHRHPAKVLVPQATFFKKIRKGVLSQSQFANPLTDSTGTFHKPAGW